MYLRRKKSPNSPRASLQIVEGYRNKEGKVKQKILRHVGVFADNEEEAKLVALAEEIIVKLKRQREEESGQANFLTEEASAIRKPGRPKRKNLSDILPVSEVKLSDITEERRIVEGVHEVGSHVYKQLGFNSLLTKKREQKILQDLTLARMVSPNSKRGLTNFLSKQFDIEHNLDAVYRMMDKLHPEISKIKELAFNSTLQLMPNQEASFIFFDVTTLYFESTNVDDLRKFGYSKDHRFNSTQLVLALATNEDGLPIGYELFSGNTAEVKSLIAAINSWQSFIKVKDVCFVADRAMFSKANLELLEKSGYRYVVAAKLRGLKDGLKQEILSGENYQPAIIGNNFGWIAEFKHEGRRLITSYKEKRAKHDAKKRQEVLTKIEKTLGKNGDTKKLISNNGVKKYTSIDAGTSYLDTEKIEQEAMWDGIHGVITNDTNSSSRDIIARYSRLWVIEQAFRINKHNLQMRPIFHWTQSRIESHIAICYMSFCLLKQIEYRVALTQKVSINNVIDSLMATQSSILRHTKTGDLYRLPGAFSNQARKIYKAFNLTRSQMAEIYQP